MSKLDVVFIPVSDLEWYGDFEDAIGYGGHDQIMVDDDGEGRSGILVLKSDEKKWRENVGEFEKWRGEDEDDD